jgi:manganese oxidase
MNTQLRRRGFWMLGSLQLWLLGCTTLQADISSSKVITSCEGVPLIAEVVAFEQAIVVNRFGAFMPGGMLYALKRDVVRMDDNKPLIEIPESEWPQLAGRVKLRDSKRPRPLVLRANEKQCIDVRLHNLMTPDVTASKESEARKIPAFRRGRPLWDSDIEGPSHMVEPDSTLFPLPDGTTGRELVKIPNDELDAPRTRAVSFHVTGLSIAPIRHTECPLATEKHPWVCGSDAFVGNNVGIVNAATEAGLKSRLIQQGSLIYPGQSAVYRYIAEREGTYFAHSLGAPVGGEGDGGQLAMGLFAAVNVQSRGSSWFRSQVTNDELMLARNGAPVDALHPGQGINYEGARYPSDYSDASLRGRPVLAMLDKGEIVHSDLNAIVVPSTRAPNDVDGGDTVAGKSCAEYHQGNSCGKPYREFTVIMHDEVDIVQAFAELKDPANPLHYIKDNMGINYGVGGMGAMVVARKRGVGPAKNCPECRAEEFFLSSWANGDPALVLKWDEDKNSSNFKKKPIGAKYPDDPSNVHHSYLNDPVRFRNIHAGPKETHVFHLHAHQWVFDESAPGSTYLDSQTIAPGATFSYEIAFGGSGNRNLSPGDSIFHCHLYPHFAQGMWELWRTHDVFEQGSISKNKNPNNLSSELRRKLPDAEVEDGTEVPAIVPIPGIALAPMPSQEFAGYPFYVAGEPGHRPPQPPLDFDKLKGELSVTATDDDFADGGLPRHVLQDRHPELGSTNTTNQAEEVKWQGGQLIRLVNQDVIDEALSKGGLPAQINAAKVFARNPKALTMLAESWKELGAVKQLAYEGEPKELAAMEFHAGKLSNANFVPVSTANTSREGWNQNNSGYKTAFANVLPGQSAQSGVPTFFVNGRKPQPGAPFADPCPATYDKDNPTNTSTTDVLARVPLRTYKSAFVQTELTVNRHGWFDPQARILSLEQDVKDIINPNTRVTQPEPLFFRANSGDCIVFKSSNFVPNALALDDFQIYTPTDTIGQHIHLVKFDVTSSDGSGNGWNYEDGTYSPDEVRERLFAYNRWAHKNSKPKWFLKTHPLFAAACTFSDSAELARCEELKKVGTCPSVEVQKTWNWADEKAIKTEAHVLNQEKRLCGAQRTTQRWWADPILDTTKRKADKNYKPELGKDKDFTLRTVFTHDHFGPSSHQQHGLYAALVVEPANSVWLNLQSNLASEIFTQSSPAQVSVVKQESMGGADLSTATANKALHAPMKLRDDGGPTSPRATIVSPECINDLNSNRLGSQGLVTCSDETKRANQTRREFGVAFADFAIVYNTALEPINPENRDLSALYLGRRQVPYNMPNPLAISSEDPGTQLINYRNEPIPLRITDITATRTDAQGFEVGGFKFSQTECTVDQRNCTGDMANVFSSVVHKDRDSGFTKTPPKALFSGYYVDLLDKKLVGVDLKRIGIFANKPVKETIQSSLDDIEAWRKDFHCALYPAEALDPQYCDRLNGRKINILESWRVMGDPATPILAAYEGEPVQIRLVQGAQEAQHVFAMNGGIRWRKQPDVMNSGFVAAQPLGISEHFEFNLQLAPQRARTGRVDHLYYGSSMDQLWDGMWGVLRSYDISTALTNLPANSTVNTKQKLPFKPLLDTSANAKSLEAIASLARTAVCSQREDGTNPIISKLAASAITVRKLYENCSDKTNVLVFNQRIGLQDPDAIVYVPTVSEDANALPNLQKAACDAVSRLEPFTFRAAAGDCIEVKLTNHVGSMPQSTGLLNPNASYNLMSMITDGFNYNQMRMSGSVGLSVPMLAQDPRLADGSNIGINTLDLLEPGDDPARDLDQGSLVLPKKSTQILPNTMLYTWYAGEYALGSSGKPKNLPIEFGALPLRSFGDVINHPAHSLIGALIIGPIGSKECTDAEQQTLISQGVLHKKEYEADKLTQTSRSICGKDKNGNLKLLYRDFLLVLQDAIDAKLRSNPLPNLKGAEEPDDYGAKGINYRSEPLWSRRGGHPSIDFNARNDSDYAHIFSSKLTSNGRCQSGINPQANGTCDPETPIFVAQAGREVRFRIVHPGGHTRQQSIAISGHRWANAPYKNDSSEMLDNSDDAIKQAWTVEGNAHAVGPMMSANLLTKAGGRDMQAGDYLIHSQSSFLLDGGIWGLFRVLEKQSNIDALVTKSKEQ